MMKQFSTLIMTCSIIIFLSHSVQAENDSYESLKPYLTPTTIAVIEIDAGSLFKIENIQDELQKLSTVYHPLSKYKEAKSRLIKHFETEENKKVYAVFDTSLISRSFPFYVIPTDKKDLEIQKAFHNSNIFLSLAQILKISNDVGSYHIFKKEDSAIAVKAWDKKYIDQIEGTDRNDLLEILKQNQDSMITLAISLTPVQKRILEEQLPVISGKLGGIPKGLLTKDIQYVSVIMNKKMSQTVLSIETKDEQSAGTVLGFIKNVYKVIGESFKNSPLASSVTKSFVPVQKEGQLSIIVNHQSPAGDLLAEELKKLNNSYFMLSRRKITMNRFKQIGLAMHNYHDVNSSFPARAILSKEGKPLLSWRVSLLPYLEENKLYKKFRLDEPWDSDHNKKLIPLMPKGFHSPVSKVNHEFKTTFLCPAGEKMIMGSSNANPIRNFIDGLSNTIIVVDANDKNGVIWTKPGDYIPAKNPIDDLVGHFPDGFIVLLADGSVRFVPDKVNPELLHKLFTINGKETIPGF